MTLQQFLKTSKASDLAKALGVTPVLVSQWSSKVRRVPAERAIQIERETSGVVRCEDLRPDVDWSVLRSSKEAAA